MWNETDFLLKGFINEVKGTLTGSSDSGRSGGFGFNSSAGSVPGNGISAVSVLNLAGIAFTSSAEQGEL